jgi:DNA uptake protein ComE-like DNA-binding protein
MAPFNCFHKIELTQIGKPSRQRFNMTLIIGCNQPKNRRSRPVGLKIDGNQASVDDWLRLPGLSIHQARPLFDLTSLGVQFCCLEDIAAALGMPVARLLPLTPILRFCYYDAESPATPQLVHPNTASVEQLSKIPAVDLFLARAIVQNRLEAGNYRNLADFQRRLALNPQLVSDLMYYLRF